MVLDGSEFSIGIAVSRWNAHITDMLLLRALRALSDSGVKESNIKIVYTPGSFELPYAASQLAKNGRVDAVIALGCLVKGETAHFDHIASAVSSGVRDVGIQTGVPVIFGVLTCFSIEQAEKRSREDGLDHGYEWGLSAVEMASVRAKLAL